MAKVYRCIEKIKNKSGTKTELYVLYDNISRNTIVLARKELKGLMALNAISVENLKLTADYKIISTKH